MKACEEGSLDLSLTPEDPEDNPWIKLGKEKFTYESKRVICEEPYQSRISPLEEKDPVYEGEYAFHSSYEYLGSSQNKHVLKTLGYDSSGHGNDLHQLIIVFINNDETLTATCIAGGYHWYGSFHVKAIEKDSLVYTQSQTPDYFMAELMSSGEDNTWGFFNFRKSLL